MYEVRMSRSVDSDRLCLRSVTYGTRVRLYACRAAGRRCRDDACVPCMSRCLNVAVVVLTYSLVVRVVDLRPTAPVVSRCRDDPAVRRDLCRACRVAEILAADGAGPVCAVSCGLAVCCDCRMCRKGMSGSCADRDLAVHVSAEVIDLCYVVEVFCRSEGCVSALRECDVAARERCRAVCKAEAVCHRGRRRVGSVVFVARGDSARERRDKTDDRHRRAIRVVVVAPDVNGIVVGERTGAVCNADRIVYEVGVDPCDRRLIVEVVGRSRYVYFVDVGSRLVLTYLDRRYREFAGVGESRFRSVDGEELTCRRIIKYVGT